MKSIIPYLTASLCLIDVLYIPPLWECNRQESHNQRGCSASAVEMRGRTEQHPGQKQNAYHSQTNDAVNMRIIISPVQTACSHHQLLAFRISQSRDANLKTDPRGHKLC